MTNSLITNEYDVRCVSAAIVQEADVAGLIHSEQDYILALVMLRVGLRAGAGLSDPSLINGEYAISREAIRAVAPSVLAFTTQFKEAVL